MGKKIFRKRIQMETVEVHKPINQNGETSRALYCSDNKKDGDEHGSCDAKAYKTPKQINTASRNGISCSVVALDVRSKNHEFNSLRWDSMYLFISSSIHHLLGFYTSSIHRKKKINIASNLIYVHMVKQWTAHSECSFWNDLWDFPFVLLRMIWKRTFVFWNMC